MRLGSDRNRNKEFAKDAMKRRPDPVSIEEIVYLDEDLHTYKYFMTGQFDEEARKKEIQAHQEEFQRLERERADDNASEDGDEGSSPFFLKLQALNDKIHIFKNQFYQKQPRSNLSYDRILKEKQMNFRTFKNIYGNSGGAAGVRTVKVGDSTLLVDNKNYTYSVAKATENEARKRLLGQLYQSAQGLKDKD